MLLFGFQRPKIPAWFLRARLVEACDQHRKRLLPIPAVQYRESIRSPTISQGAAQLPNRLVYTVRLTRRCWIGGAANQATGLVRKICRSTPPHRFDVKWCAKLKGVSMASRKQKVGRPASTQPRMVRTSVGLPPDLYRTIEAIAKDKKVSTAWVVRDAVDQYVKDRWPLLGAAR
jgi:Ribbon-helix-helix protein, copG family